MGTHKLNLICSVLIIFILGGCGSTIPRKMNGVSFVASRDSVSIQQVDPLKHIGANYAAVMPFGFLRSLDSPEVIYNTERQWYGETVEGCGQYISTLSSKGIGIMLKPQLWVRRGEFTGNIQMTSDKDWRALEESYEKFILEYARLAEEMNVEIFCIGTELGVFVTERPEFWKGLIRKIREVYTGKLTYAANWDEYRRVYFWKMLDYVGVDAYFPLADSKTPSVEELREAWSPWKSGLTTLSDSLDRQIIFTEYGYRSMDYTARKPWEVTREEKSVNLQAQVNAKEALFMEFWGEDWYAGGFLWKWFINNEEAGGPADNRFTPQNKPAIEIVKKYYSSY